MRASREEIKEFFGFSEEGMEHFVHRPADAFRESTEEGDN